MKLQLEYAGESNVWVKNTKRRCRVGGKQTLRGKTEGSEKSYQCQILEKIKKDAKLTRVELIMLFECRSIRFFIKALHFKKHVFILLVFVDVGHWSRLDDILERSFFPPTKWALDT